jgi:hypothetical protein
VPITASHLNLLFASIATLIGIFGEASIRSAKITVRPLCMTLGRIAHLDRREGNQQRAENGESGISHFNLLWSDAMSRHHASPCASEDQNSGGDASAKP